MLSKNKAVEVRTIHETKEFERLEDQWNHLLAQNHTQSAFLTWEWLFSWWQVYEQGHKLWLVTAWREEELVGIIPLMLSNKQKYSLSFRMLRPLGSPHCDVSGIILKNNNEEVLALLSDFLVKQEQYWDILEFNRYAQDDPALKFIKGYFDKAGYKSRVKIYDHFYIPLKGKWDDYLANLSKKFREILRRSARRAAKIGEVSFQYFSGEEASWEIFQKIIEINRYSKYPIIYQSEKEQIFHKKLFTRMPGKGLLNIFLLEVDNIPVAYQYGFVQNKRYEPWRVAYDFRFPPRVSVGTLLYKLATEKAFELGYTEIDFLRGDEAYKLNWKPEKRKYVKIRFIRRNNFLALFIFIWLPQVKKLFSRVKRR